MDPLIAATTFATIVGLLSNFKSERESSSEDEYKEFVSWLDEKRHKSLLNEIRSNHLLALGIKSLLNQHHDVVLKKLSDLDETLLVLSSSINGFKEISNALAPNIELSKQSISIIVQLDKSGGSSFLEHRHESNVQLILLDSNGYIKIEEPRFIEDDLTQMVNLKLLLLDYNSIGQRKFRLTRMAVKFLEQL